MSRMRSERERERAREREGKRTARMIIEIHYRIIIIMSL